MAYKRSAATPGRNTGPVAQETVVCETKCCGIVDDRNAKSCADHALAPQRVEYEAEFTRSNNEARRK